MIVLRIFIFALLLVWIGACADEGSYQPQATAPATQPAARPGGIPPQGPVDRGLPENSIVPGSHDTGLLRYPSDEVPSR